MEQRLNKAGQMGTSLYIYVSRDSSPTKPCVNFHHNTEALEGKEVEEGNNNKKNIYIYIKIHFSVLQKNWVHWLSK